MDNLRLASDDLSAFLKMDCFDAEQLIRYPGESENTSIVKRNVFFEQIYSPIKDNSILLRSANEDKYLRADYSKWTRKLKRALRSWVVFVEGYAGCGKTVFVQNVLSKVFPNYDYDKNYYNYNIGTTVADESCRIKEAILGKFIKSYIDFHIHDHDDVIEQMEVLLSQDKIDILDSSQSIYEDFTFTGAYEEAKNFLYEQNSEDKFRGMLFSQLKHLSIDKIIYIDCILRLAKYITVREEPETQIICYDNLDAIENNTDLCEFDDVLLTVKENVDNYLKETQENYKGKGTPHFVFMAAFRKITAAKVGLYNKSERSEDNTELRDDIFYIDASHLYDFSDMVSRRADFLRMFMHSQSLEKDEDFCRILAQMDKVVELQKVDFVKQQYSEFWNNNIRTCSDVMGYIFEDYEDAVDDCILLAKSEQDCYDDRICTATGASAVFLSALFNVQRDRNYWSSSHFDLSDLNKSCPSLDQLNQESNRIHEVVTLSRLLITYVCNVARYEDRDVSTKELFTTFYPVFTTDEIANTLANLLKHDYRGTWRRPIVYTREAKSEENVRPKDVFKYQGSLFMLNPNWRDDEFTSFTSCACGDSFVNSISCDYEYYSTRLGNVSSLYVVDKSDDAISIIDSVYDAVASCIRKMKVFRQYYCEKKRIDYKQYSTLMFHPRTYSGNPQFNTERVIFNHIDYLDNYRMYLINNGIDIEEKEKDAICGYVLQTIGKYLDLFYRYIEKVDGRRRIVADELKSQLEIITNNPKDHTTRVHCRSKLP